MRCFSGIFNGLAKSLHSSKEDDCRLAAGGAKAADVMAREARKNGLILRSSGTMRGDGSNCFVSAYSKRGEKGINQDCFIVWEEFGCQEDMIYCGVFDGHGPWGHHVAKTVRDSLPSSLLCSLQEALAFSNKLHPELDLVSEKNKNPCRFDMWKQSFLSSCTAVDEELRKSRALDSFCSGTTALSIIKQGELMVIANVGDSRAVLATTGDDGSLIPVQLTVDFKPNLPQETERILECQGRVFCLHDEPGVHRVWLPNEEAPGLAMSRAFGDHCIKDFGLISTPEVTQRSITAGRDQFVVLATDGVWDVISNQEAVKIVSSAQDRGRAARRLVESAVGAWRRKRRGVALDDCSAVCVFFNSSAPCSRVDPC